MKALTIHQPYAAFIMLPDDNPDAKRIENRNWRTNYRGPVAIHAAKSRESLNCECEDDFVFGAVLGTAEIVDCIDIDDFNSVEIRKFYPWVKTHKHTHGPYCFILTNIQPFREPIPASGSQGFWNWVKPIEVVA